jgi:hypothetical protein
MTTTIRLSRTTVRLTSALLACGAVMAGLSACGGSTPLTSTAAPGGGATTGAPGDSTIAGPLPGGRGFDPAQLQKIRECLSAAGIQVDLPSGRPSFSGSRPSFSPGERPSFLRPSDFPSGAGPNGVGGGFGALFADPKVKAALDACGIPLPSFGARNRTGQGQTPAAS